MTFLHPAALWGLLAAGVPLLIHLWGRQRPRRVPFPSLRLLKAGERRQRSFSRIRDLLLLLLRMLLIWLVALALAGPTVETRAHHSFPESAASPTLLLDVSASMGCKVGDETALSRGIRAAEMILHSLPDGQQAELLVLGAELEAIQPEGLPRVRERPVRADVMWSLLRSGSDRIWGPDAQVFIITDLQATSFGRALPEALPQPPVIVDVGHPRAANRYFRTVRTVTPCPLRGRPLELRAEMGESGKGELDEPGRVTASIAGNTVPGQTAIFRQGRAKVSLRATPQAGGPAVWELELDGDCMDADNTFRLVEPVRELLEVAIIAGESDASLAATALNPGGEAETHIRVRSLRWGQIAGELPTADAYIAADVPDDWRAGLLEDLLRRGKGVLLFAGTTGNVSAGMLSRMMGAGVSVGRTVAAPRNEPWTLADVETHPGPLQPFANPRAGNLAAFSFSRRRELTVDAQARVLAWFSDGSPAIIGSADPGRRCILLNTSVDDSWNDAPFQPAFVPFIHHLCYHLAGPVIRNWPDGWAGQALRIAVPIGSSGECAVTAPDGQVVTQRPQRGGWQYTPSIPGVYEAAWNEGSRRVRQKFAANVHPLESDLSRISVTELRRRLKAPEARVIRLEELGNYLSGRASRRVNLAFPLLALALIMLAADTLLSARPSGSLDEEGRNPCVMRL
ncbi:MAG: BatA domain-containing protein [Armatimonadetes bacterium]|nr:BatA domain-containing protein [Armatimonadota bacterium]